jgi:hypothetical protein
MSKEEYLIKEKELDNKIKTIWLNPFLDGITNYDLYSKASIKLLWILKEPNGRNNSESRDMRIYHADVSGYDYWQVTFRNMIRIGHAIIDGIYEFNDIPPINYSNATIGQEELVILDDIAIINVNKTGGGSSSDQIFLNNEYERRGVKELLFEQIELINPQIIINSHHVEKFFKDQIGDSEILRKNTQGLANFAYTEDRRLIIFTDHPGQRNYSDKVYCDNIISIVNNYF